MFRTALKTTIAAATLVGGLATVTSANASAVKVFHTPTIKGQEIDVRFKRHQPKRPALVANKFCKTNGYLEASNWSTKKFSSTRTLGDRRVLKRKFGQRPVGFTQIVCSGIKAKVPSKFTTFKHLKLESQKYGNFTEFRFNKTQVANSFCLTKRFERASAFRFTNVGQPRTTGNTLAVYNPVAQYASITSEKLPIVAFKN